MKLTFKTAALMTGVLVLGTSQAMSQEQFDRGVDQPSVDSRATDQVTDETDRRNRAGRRSQSNERDARGQSDHQEALQHFLAGYYAGYSEGYYDGYDDSALLIVETVQGHSKDRQERDSQANRPEQMQRQRERMRNQLRGQHQFPDRAGLQEVSGQVTDSKTVPIHGTDTEHVVVRLKTDFGDRKIVDLGPKQNLDAWEIKEGLRLSIQGQSVQTQDMRVIAARRVHANGKTVDVKYIRPKFVKDAAEEADEDFDESKSRPRRRTR